jgi:predicted phosphodiesterase
MNNFPKVIRSGLVLLFCVFTLELFSQDTIRVFSGIDRISTAIDSAKEGDLILLMSDGGNYIESRTITIEKDISIKASLSIKQKPVLQLDDTSCIIKVSNNFTIEGVIFNGELDTLRCYGGIYADSSGYKLSIENCDFINFNGYSETGGFGISNGEKGDCPDSLIISNCTFRNIRNNGIILNGVRNDTGNKVRFLSIINSTFSQIEGNILKLQGSNNGNGDLVSMVVVDHCTFSTGISKNKISVLNMKKFMVSNSIFYSDKEENNLDLTFNGDDVEISRSIYFNTSINTSGRITHSKSSDPLFVEPGYGNFSLYKNSPAIGWGSDSTTIGDPRWGISNYLSTELMFVKEPYSMSPTTGSVRILWETPERRSTVSIVEYGTDSTMNKKVMGEDGWLINGEGYMHEVTITGLNPFTQYYYRVSDGIRKGTMVNITKSAPSKGDDFRIMAISDTHDNSGMIWQEISKIALKDSLDLTVFIGDCVNNGHLRTTWNNGFFIPGKPLLSNCVSIYAMGNHDTDHGPTTALDYFSLPTHPDNGDDPEAYYSLNYGDVKMMILNLTEDELSPAFNEGSPQYIWFEDELKNADSKWIFVFTHINLLSTGLHSQESANQKKYILPLVEKYAIQGKHILVIGGHEHNFEHLYKNGVNHIRAGCANIMRRDQYTIVDLPYSKYFKNTAGYSTFDIRENGNVVHLQAQDSTGSIFYEAMFDARENYQPSIYLTEPDGYNDSTTTNFRISWKDSDPDNNARISLYYTIDSLSTENGILITDSIKEDDPEDFYQMDIGEITPGSYYIYAEITDSINEPVYSFSKGKVTIVADSIGPKPAVNLEGSYSHEEIRLTWENPTGTIPYENRLADFEGSRDGFIVQTKDTTLLELIPNGQGGALRIHYQNPKAATSFSAIEMFTGYPDFHQGATINFCYRGDSSENKLLLVIRQDNDRNGISDDWWCSDTLILNSNDWQHVSIPFDSLNLYPTHPNSKARFDGENMFSFDFIFNVARPDSGYADIDSIRITGNILTTPDFKGVGLFRRDDRYPDKWEDGDLVYLGDDETCVDQTVYAGHKYFYTLFTYDYFSNRSLPDTTAFWESDLLTENNLISNHNGIPLFLNYPNPFDQTTTIHFTMPKAGKIKIDIYTISGQKVTNLVNGFVEEGEHSVVFNPAQSGVNLSGIYFYKIEVDGFTKSKKMMFTKR